MCLTELYPNSSSPPPDLKEHPFFIVYKENYCVKNLFYYYLSIEPFDNKINIESKSISSLSSKESSFTTWIILPRNGIFYESDVEVMFYETNGT